MITCESCGCENDDQFKYCRKCGTPLEEDSTEEDDSDEPDQINCPSCGMEQPSNFKFCGACGERIPDSASSEQPAAVSNTSDGAGAPADSRSDSGHSTGRQAYGQEVDSDDGGAAPAPATGVSSSRSVGRLVVIQPDGTEGASIDIPPDRITIGRDSDIESLSDDYFLSPNHASLLYRDGRFVIRDEDSVNGIFREVVDQTPLSDGDLIRIGKELLEFETFPEPRGPADDDTKLAGSPDPGYWGRLSLIVGPNLYTETYALEDERTVIGRQNGDIVFQDDGFVSGTHAAVLQQQGTPILRDLDSSNGTFVRIDGEYELESGDKILMGQQLFKLEA